MKLTLSRFIAILLVVFWVSSGMRSPVNAQEAGHEHDAGSSMEMHHMHLMMNHGLAMVAEGSNLVMLAEMKMSPDLDPVALNHGRSMMEEGKEMIQHMLSGPEMEAMHKSGHGNAPLMVYTHSLAKAMLDYVDMLQNMKMGEMKPEDTMTMHHMHILINHAMEMAAEGSKLVMIGQMEMAKDMDRHSVEHGRKMLTEARELIKEVMEGKAMSAMHTRQTGSSSEMAYTHNLAKAATDLLDLMEKMPGA